MTTVKGNESDLISQSASQKNTQENVQSQEPDDHFKVSAARRKAKVPTNQMDTSQRLDYACDALAYDRKNLHSYTTIDFCLDEIGRIDWVHNFVNLKELTIVNQSVTEIEGVQNCRYLEKIWLQNNNIETIKNVDKLPCLRQLFLSSNKIKKISGLDGAMNLDKLWLDGNLIEQVDGLAALVNLTELNLAMNHIETIGISLDNLKSIRDLNLSGNRIGSFKEILNLTRLPNLQYCSFSDPNYGENPICSLCNYQTYVMFHLINLVRLDMTAVGEDVKAFAESTFMKKRMYYNMRIKTIQRNTSNIMKLLKICKRLRISKIESQTSKLTKKLQEVSREIDERALISAESRAQFQSVCTYGPDNLTSNPLNEIEEEVFKAEIEQKRGVILGRMLERNQDLKKLESQFKSIKNEIYEMTEQNIGRLMTELDTGGNIRFEEGRPQDKWYTSCVDLVRSRFSSEQMKNLGVLGITVTRVTRIHNRFLRNRFEEKLEQLVDLSDNQYKRSLEYLFYGVNPQAPKEIHRVMEQGFRTFQEYEEQGLPGCISLVNSVASAETPRINLFLNQKSKSKSEKSESKKKQSDAKLNKKSIPSGQILVCKIFLQKCVHDQKTPFFDSELSPTEIWGQSPINPIPYQKVQSVYRVKESDPKQRMWYVIDNALVLPEYLVDFDYNMSTKDISESKRLSEISVLNEECNQLFNGVTEASRVLETTSSQQFDNKGGENRPPLTIVGLTTQDLDRTDMNYVKKPLHHFMTECHVKELMENNYEFQDEQKNGQPTMEDSLPPEIPLRSQLTLLSESIVINLSCQTDLTKITYLNLFNNCIRKIEALESLINLEILILSFNQIQEIKGLSKNENLVRLEINNNFIRKIDDSLSAQTKLTRLNLAHNWLQEISQVQNLVRQCPKLKDLNLKGNPIANLRQYRVQVFGTLNQLESLDGVSQQKSDRESSRQEVDLSAEMIHSAVKQIKKFQHNRGELIDGWQSAVEELSLCHLKVTKIANLESFSGLRKLSLLDNKISIISGLEKLTYLEELSLEKNKITSILNLESLKYLKKLDLGSNKIKKIHNLNALTNLAQLSLENNEISRLDGLQDLQFLMELYLGNNSISDIREIVKLKDLPRLIILDISCNPGANSQSNRVYCIFHLRKLRVLDGISIDPQEHLEAKETFSGRLTEEIMNSRLQGRKLTEMRDLDLSNCKLRDFDDMFDSQKIPNIKELNLNNNMMGSLRFLGFLPSLKVLRLRGNRIETLYCKPNPEDKVFKKGLFGMPSLELLDVSQNLLQYLYGLQFANLKELKVLQAAENQIVRIEHLEKLKGLRELDLSRNKISKIDQSSFPLPNQITLLKLEENNIKQLVFFENLGRLQSLLLANNRIGEFNELERIADLPDLVEFSLVSNPIQRKQNYRFAVIKRIPQLIIFDGKEIPPDERKRIELAGGSANDAAKQQAPLIHFAVFPGGQGKVPVRVNNVNFDSMFQNKTDPQGAPQNALQQRQFERQFQGLVDFAQPQMGLQIQSSLYQDQNRVVPLHELAVPIQDNQNQISRGAKRPVTNKQLLISDQAKPHYQPRTEPNSVQSHAPSTFQTVNREKQASQQYFQKDSSSTGSYPLQNPISISNQSKPVQQRSRQSAQFIPKSLSNNGPILPAASNSTIGIQNLNVQSVTQPLHLPLSQAQQQSKTGLMTNLPRNR